MKTNPPVTFWLWCALIAIASFMPWSSVGPISLPFFGLSASQIVTAWTSYTTIFGLIVPNWAVVIVALALALFSWLNVKEIWQAQPRVNLLLAGYGIIHLLFFIIPLVDSQRGRLGIGSITTLVAFVAIFIYLFKNRKAPQGSG